jgi:phospholipase/carboxylesterase
MSDVKILTNLYIFMNRVPQVIRSTFDKSITLMSDNPSFSLIWLHGLGDSSEGFYEYFMHPKSPVYDGARVRLLQAPLRPVTINHGAPCNSWYDIKTFDKTSGKE